MGGSGYPHSWRMRSSSLVSTSVMTEVYREGNMGAQDYRMELWVPIIKVD